jgi:2-hydroxychromene-2-carboxylate isomerase
MFRTFEFIFDFAAPNGYLAHKVLPAFCEANDATVIYVPCLIGGMMKATGNKPPLVRYADAPARMAYEQLEMKRFITAHSLDGFTMNPHFPVNSLTIMRGAIAAQNAGVFETYADAMFAAMWEQGANLSDSAVIASVLTVSGLDAELIMERASDQEVKDELIANTEHAVARGAFGVPTFFVGEEIFFGKERLGQVAAALTD